MTAEPTTSDYSQTLYLPKTDFPMRAGLPQKEPEILARWAGDALYAQLRAAGKGRDRFTLHDGPPYANGNIHIGHALNKILKDLVTRSQQMAGKDSNYVPGWDCHGLPIEWKVEEENYRKKGKQKPDFKDAKAIIAFRQECRAYAQGWIDVQREEFKRLGIVGDWDHPYLTMTFAAEAQIAREIMKFAANGLLYRGSKPVMWSVVEKTALAEAEVEYEDYVSDAVFVAFPVWKMNVVSGLPVTMDDAGNFLGPAQEDMLESQARMDAIQNASVVIWTTTPWTLPGNRAISFSSRISYGLYRVTNARPENWAKVGAHYIISDKLAGELFKAARVESYERLYDVPTASLIQSSCRHSLAKILHGYEIEIPLLSGDHVTDDAGTGFVHTAPSHGREDWDVWQANARALAARGIVTRIPTPVDENGAYTADAPGFEGKRVITDKGDKGDANEAVIKALIEAGALVARGKLNHQYPHSWRSKKPVIYINTPQWFIAMDKAFAPGGAGAGVADPGCAAATADSDPGYRDAGGETAVGDRGYNAHNLPTLRSLALDEIKRTRWVPKAGENRITGMIQAKPDWVVSRQRAWGVPIAVFVKKGEHTPLVDESVNKRIADAFETEGADAWYAEGAAERFLAPDFDPAAYEKVTDILDVWFDSGSTHAYVLDDPKHFASLAGFTRIRDGGGDEIMYLEGSDQHRGWFHSSLLESCGTRGRAPYDVVLTHGFTLDEKGRKMSKSLGNQTFPQDVIKQSGADILRLWTASVDYSDDQRIGPEILKSVSENYRKLRNTMRWMLGALAHRGAGAALDLASLDGLDRLMLHRLAELDGLVREAYLAFDYAKVVSSLSGFLNTDLSAFYFDVRKDTLYCEPPDSAKRLGALAAIEAIFKAVTVWLAPILVFTCEEAWGRFMPGAASVHLEQFPTIPAAWRDDALAAQWETIRRVRSVVTGALEIARAEKRIGSSLEAIPRVVMTDAKLCAALEGVDFAEVCITSDVESDATGDVPGGAFALPDVPGVSVVVERADAKGWVKCARSWRYFDPKTASPDYPDVTPRDAEALRQLKKAAA